MPAGVCSLPELAKEMGIANPSSVDNRAGDLNALAKKGWVELHACGGTTPSGDRGCCAKATLTPPTPLEGFASSEVDVAAVTAGTPVVAAHRAQTVRRCVR